MSFSNWQGDEIDQAAAEGRRAFALGQKKDANPYWNPDLRPHEQSDRANAWEDGHRECREQ